MAFLQRTYNTNVKCGSVNAEITRDVPWTHLYVQSPGSTSSFGKRLPASFHTLRTVPVTASAGRPGSPAAQRAGGDLPAPRPPTSSNLCFSPCSSGGQPPRGQSHPRFSSRSLPAELSSLPSPRLLGQHPSFRYAWGLGCDSGQ